MKQLISLIVIFLMISCADQNLVKENEELRQLAEELRERADLQSDKALMAAAEATRQMRLTEEAREESREEVARLKKQLEDCK